LFDLGEDPNERNDLAAARPAVLARMLELATTSRTPSELFPSPFDEQD